MKPQPRDAVFFGLILFTGAEAIRVPPEPCRADEHLPRHDGPSPRYRTPPVYSTSGEVHPGPQWIDGWFLPGPLDSGWRPTDC